MPRQRSSAGANEGLGSPTGAASREWLGALRRWLAVMAAANLLWETAHLPLYTIWDSGSPSELAFAVIHCTGGDILIGLSSLTLALLLIGDSSWPVVGRIRIGALTMAFGLSYTIFSEWLNIEVRQAWEYGDLMPIVPLINTGVSPILQWSIIPLVAFWWAYEPAK